MGVTGASGSLLKPLLEVRGLSHPCGLIVGGPCID
jgi:hypothetical protein